MTAPRIFAVAAAVLCMAIAGRCGAQNFPLKPIHLVVPYGAGGTPDVLSRWIAQRLTERIGQPVIVDNRPGASGVIAADIVAKSSPDGYALFVGDTGHLAINPSLQPNWPYDALRDFAPVTLAASGPYYMAVSSKLPVNSVADLIAYARSNPGLPYGSSGNGSAHHLGMELFRLMADLKMTHIPYKGVAQSVPAVVSGEVAVVLAALPSLTPHVKSGKVRILAFARVKRTPATPDIPTIAESGVPGYDLETGVGYLAPANTPKDIVAKLSTDIGALLKLPEAAQQLAVLGIEPIGNSPEQFGETIRAWIQKYSKLVKDVGARAD